MKKTLPFTAASLSRAIKGVEMAGLYVVGVKPDGTIIVSSDPIDATVFAPQTADETPSKWETFRA